MRLGIYCAAAAMALFGNTASALVVGDFIFDDDAFADRAVISSTVSGTRGPAVGVESAADGDLSTAANINDSFVEIFFDDNVLINGPGEDIVIFSGTNNNVIRLSTGPQTAVVTGSGNFIPSGATGNTSGFSLNGAAIDLSTLGFADGAEVTDGLFLSRGGVFTTVWDVAALNSRSVVSAVPLPASLPLMLGAIGVLGLVRRLRS